MLLIKKCAFFCYVLPCSLTVIVEVAIVVIKVLYHYFLILYLGKYCSFQMIPFKDSQINLLKGMQIRGYWALHFYKVTFLGSNPSQVYCIDNDSMQFIVVTVFNNIPIPLV